MLQTAPLPYKIDLRDQVQKKIDKILEPPPVKSAKPLPRPDDAPKKKRGGRRYRILNIIIRGRKLCGASKRGSIHLCTRHNPYACTGRKFTQLLPVSA